MRSRELLLVIAACASACSSASDSLDDRAVSATTSEDVTAAPVLVAPRPPPAVNTVQVTMDRFPSASLNFLDTPFVTVTICVPGTKVCQTIDHVVLDTGSTGLRFTSGALNAKMLSGLPNTKHGGKNVAECYFLGAGYLFGSVRTADVTIGGEKVSAMPIQVTDDITVTSDCETEGGTSAGEVDTLGGNAILGIYPGFNPDCGSDCNTPSNADGSAFYYTCTGNTCAAAGVPNSIQLPNPVALFATDNNGYSLEMQAVDDEAGAVNPVGTLTFGIDTRSNNRLGSATIIQRNNPGTTPVTTAQIGTTQFGHVIVDSGTTVNALHDPPLPACNANGKFAGFFCPPTTEKLTATLNGINGVSHDIQLTIGNVKTLVTNNPHSTGFDDLAADNGAPDGDVDDNVLYVGAPYFLGHKVFFGLIGNTIHGVPGQLYAF